jgi:LPXTG-motif cell wall-anchored protein/uncharacterized repeat protein (TIGR01451 family)
MDDRAIVYRLLSVVSENRNRFVASYIGRFVVFERMIAKGASLMANRSLLLDWRQGLLAATGSALLLLAFLYGLGTHTLQVAHAQGPGTLSMAITKTLDGSPVVTVGQYVNFTIRITNTGTISITRLPVIDDYDARVLRLDQTTPPPSTSGNGQITWTNLPTDVVGGPLRPGQTFTIKTRFRVIGISNYTVNRARIQDAIGMGGQSGGNGSGQGGGQTEGGRVVVEKSLAPGVTPQSGRPVTFTVSVRNEGAADLVRVPVQDTYPAQYLQFWKAVPPPSQITASEIRWDDVLPALGLTRLRPNEVVTITTVFTALKSIDAGLINSAGAAGVRDEFQNDLPAPRRAEVPIRIVAGPGEIQPTATAKPKPKPKPEQATPTPETPTTAAITPTAVITSTADLSSTAGAAATPTVVPARLPRTGATETNSAWLMVALALMLGGALVLLYRRAGSR